MHDAHGSGLILGGGGVTGIAWELGLLMGLADAGVELWSADVVVGTSAGSVVGAQITGSTSLTELYQRQLEPPSAELPARLTARDQLAYAIAFVASRGDLSAFGRRLGAWSIQAADAGGLPTVGQRLAVIESRLPSSDWPERDLRVTVVDAHTGEFRIITGPDGVALADAVAASCAVPGVFPPIPIEGRLYVDGGVRSSANADVARGCSKVVVLAPLVRGFGAARSPQRQVDRLGVPSVVIAPDRGSRAAIGKNVLDPAGRRGAAEAGLAQATRAVAQVRRVWG
ncbi:MAG: patatin-like phospholipase family protein [Solirubrobacteraceae bacterium]